MAHYGIGELTSVTILAELGDCRRLLLLAPGRPLLRAGHHRLPVRPAPRARPPLPPGTASAALGAVRSRPSRTPPAQPGPRLLRPGRRAARRQPRLPRDRAQAAHAQLPHAARARRGGARNPHDPPRCARKPSLTPMRRGQLPPCSLPTPPGGRPTKTERPQRFPQRDQSR